MSSQEASKEPTVITLDNTNSVKILAQYVELGQQKGAYLLNEAEILKRGIDVLINNVPDTDITPVIAKSVLIQGVNKAQRHGAYTLNDASLLNKVVQFIVSNDTELQSLINSATAQQAPAPTQAPTQTPTQTQIQDLEEVEEESSDDLSDLADPIPLKPKEV
jgi:hypothetical protein